MISHGTKFGILFTPWGDLWNMSLEYGCSVYYHGRLLRSTPEDIEILEAREVSGIVVDGV
jgi:hypothetical protein